LSQLSVGRKRCGFTPFLNSKDGTTRKKKEERRKKKEERRKKKEEARLTIANSSYTGAQ